MGRLQNSLSAEGNDQELILAYLTVRAGANLVAHGLKPVRPCDIWYRRRKVDGG